jgi:hypothetical protein
MFSNFAQCRLQTRFLEKSPTLHHRDFLGGEVVEAEGWAAADGEGDFVVGVFDGEGAACFAYLLASK